MAERASFRAGSLIGRFDRLGLLAFPVFAFVLLAPAALAGKTHFWGDLTYLHHGWKGFSAQVLHAGDFPLWNPHLYLGIPWHANMQTGIFYPGSLLFFLFPFSFGLVFHLWFHFSLCGALAFLAMRSLGVSRGGALVGGLLWAFGGVMVSRIPFVNHMACLAFFPGLLLCRRNPGLLTVALVLGLLSGYPTIWVGMVAWVGAFSLLVHRRLRTFQAWLGALALCAGLSAAMWIPAFELLGQTARAKGLDLSITTLYSFVPFDFLQWVSPWLSAEPFHAGERWWKTCYIGISGAALAGSGFWVSRGRSKAAAFLLFVGVGVLLLGKSTPVSFWIWKSFPPLRVIRYPGNLSYLLLPVLALLAAGALRRRWTRFLVPIVAAELLVLGWLAFPVVSVRHFTERGPLSDLMDRDLRGHRYLLSPRAFDWSRGQGATLEAAAVDLRHRFYGISNTLYRYDAVGNFGEPLVPEGNMLFLDFLFSRPGLAAAAPWFPFVDVRYAMTRDAFAAPAPLEDLGRRLWQVYRVKAKPARAFFYPKAQGGYFGPAAPRALPPRGADLVFEPRGPRRFKVSGRASRRGFVFVSAPRYDGWRAYRQGFESPHDPAWGAFFRIPVPPGPFRLDFYFTSFAFQLGAWLSLLFLGAFAAYWYNRARQWEGIASV